MAQVHGRPCRYAVSSWPHHHPGLALPRSSISIPCFTKDFLNMAPVMILGTYSFAHPDSCRHTSRTQTNDALGIVLFAGIFFKLTLTRIQNFPEFLLNDNQDLQPVSPKAMTVMF